MSTAIGCERQEYAKSGGDALASLKAKPYRKHVSDHGQQRGKGGKRVELCRAGGRNAREGEHQEDRQPALERIQHEGGDGQPLAAGAGHVGCANVSAANRTHIDPLEDAHQNVAEGNRAEKIGTDGNGDQSWSSSWFFHSRRAIQASSKASSL